MTARAEHRAPISSRESASVGEAFRRFPSGPMRYVLAPDALIATYANDPLAIGVYAAIARLCVAAKHAVPIAAHDLVVWMGSQRDADRAAIMRRIVKLEEGGWVIVERTTATKHRLLPTWGRDQAGTVRPWHFDRGDSGRPDHVRGRRVPLALFDEYLGRLDPQPGPARALVSRYFTRPLLDLTDIGVYTIGLRAEVMPTPRLVHLGLYCETGMLPPPDSQSLLAQAAARTLTTVADGITLPVSLTMQGQARLGGETPLASLHIPVCDAHLCGSIRRSPDGSLGGSCDVSPEDAVFPHQDGQHASESSTVSLIAWDVGSLHESINHDSTPEHGLVDGGGTASRVDDALAEDMPVRITSVVAGHRALNPNRSIPPGEWHELLALQETHGEADLLVWQARASRAATERPFGITPAYYQACAAQAACDAYRPTRTGRPSVASDRDVASERPGVPATLDPACDALLQAMGVRQRHQLGAVAYDLIAAWQTALTHPGMLARCTSPVGFAVAQMQRGHAPPPVAELDRWAEQARRKDDRYEVWRYVDAPPVDATKIAHEQHLEARVRAIAPPDADLADLCELARCIEAGASDAEALGSLHTRHAGGRA